ncbi:hypothetical protein [Thermaerobacter litoralis]
MTANLLPLEHLTDADFQFLAAAVSPRPDARDRIARLLRDGGEAIERALEDGRTHQALQEGEAAQRISPYLLFAVLLHRHRVAERARAGEAPEGAEEPVPAAPVAPPAETRAPAGDPPCLMLDGPVDGPAVRDGGLASPVRRLLESPWTIHYLAELLASFAYTPPGIAAFSLGGRQFRLPLAEVDLAALNKVALLAAEPERLSIYRRLGDLTLFLSSVAVKADEGAGAAARERELEREGRRFYEYAAQHRGATTTYLGRTLMDLSGHYAVARSLLRRIVHQELPQVYPGGLDQMAARWGDTPQPGLVALSAPERPLE